MAKAKAPARTPAQFSKSELERLSTIEAADLDFEDGEQLPFRYAMVHAVMDTTTIERIDDDGFPYKATKVSPRTRGIMVELHEMIMHPETGAQVIRPRPFHFRLPFATYNNRATKAGFKSEQIVRALMKMDRCSRGVRPIAGDHFYLVPVTAEEIKQKRQIASDPDVAKKLAKLQALNNAPMPTVTDLLYGEATEKAEVEVDAVAEEFGGFAA